MKDLGDYGAEDFVMHALDELAFFFNSYRLGFEELLELILDKLAIRLERVLALDHLKTTGYFIFCSTL